MNGYFWFFDKAWLITQRKSQLLRPQFRHLAVIADAVDSKEVPIEAPGVDAVLLDPRFTWADPTAYDKQARKLVEMFQKNFAQYVPFNDEDVRAAAM